MFIRLFRRACLAAVFSSLFLTLPTASFAARDSLDPHENCKAALVQDSGLDQIIVSMWAYGYLAKTLGTAPVVRADQVRNMNKILNELCQKDPTLTLAGVIHAMTQSQYTTGGQAQSAPGDEASARALLQKFLDPSQDRAALTAALKPTLADIQVVYKEPLASKLAASYEQAFKPGIAFGPKPGQNALLVTYTTTGKLHQRHPDLQQFPGGYKDVLPFLVSDVPIVRFKFVKSGETLGLAFDGLVFVNGRWVIMPKPWRGLN